MSTPFKECGCLTIDKRGRNISEEEEADEEEEAEKEQVEQEEEKGDDDIGQLAAAPKTILEFLLIARIVFVLCEEPNNLIIFYTCNEGLIKQKNLRSPNQKKNQKLIKMGGTNANISTVNTRILLFLNQSVDPYQNKINLLQQIMQRL